MEKNRKKKSVRQAGVAPAKSTTNHSGDRTNEAEVSTNKADSTFSRELGKGRVTLQPCALWQG